MATYNSSRRANYQNITFVVFWITKKEKLEIGGNYPICHSLHVTESKGKIEDEYETISVFLQFAFLGQSYHIDNVKKGVIREIR